jgi:hypothetical protein
MRCLLFQRWNGLYRDRWRQCGWLCCRPGSSSSLFSLSLHPHVFAHPQPFHSILTLSLAPAVRDLVLRRGLQLLGVYQLLRRLSTPFSLFLLLLSRPLHDPFSIPLHSYFLSTPAVRACDRTSLPSLLAHPPCFTAAPCCSAFRCWNRNLRLLSLSLTASILLFVFTRSSFLPLAFLDCLFSQSCSLSFILSASIRSSVLPGRSVVDTLQCLPGADAGDQRVKNEEEPSWLSSGALEQRLQAIWRLGGERVVVVV